MLIYGGTVDRDWRSDHRLTLKGRGLIDLLEHAGKRPALTVERLVLLTADGDTSIRTGIRDLIDLGYLEKRPRPGHSRMDLHLTAPRGAAGATPGAHRARVVTQTATVGSGA